MASEYLERVPEDGEAKATDAFVSLEEEVAAENVPKNAEEEEKKKLEERAKKQQRRKERQIIENYGTLTRFYLAQSYGGLGNAPLSAKYIAETLGRQLSYNSKVLALQKEL